MKDFAVFAGVVLVLLAGIALGFGAGQEFGARHVREQVAKRHLGQFYLDPHTGKVGFQYLDLQSYTQNLIEQLTPQRVPGPTR